MVVCVSVFAPRQTAAPTLIWTRSRKVMDVKVLVVSVTLSAGCKAFWNRLSCKGSSSGHHLPAAHLRNTTFMISSSKHFLTLQQHTTPLSNSWREDALGLCWTSFRLCDTMARLWTGFTSFCFFLKSGTKNPHFLSLPNVSLLYFKPQTQKNLKLHLSRYAQTSSSSFFFTLFRSKRETRGEPFCLLRYLFWTLPLTYFKK